jgi:aconitate hydratase 2/2-methylisocitrate dehydratase
MLEEYQQHVAQRASEGIVPKPLNAKQTAQLCELIKAPAADQTDLILDLLANRVPAGVDEAAYVKASFLAAIAKGSDTSPILTPERATELLGTMLGGYNVAPLIDLLESDNPTICELAARGLSSYFADF